MENFQHRLSLAPSSVPSPRCTPSFDHGAGNLAFLGIYLHMAIDGLGIGDLFKNIRKRRVGRGGIRLGIAGNPSRDFTSHHDNRRIC